MTLPGGTPIGKYIVRRKLAEGGMAEIYVASAIGPEGFQKDVVIKRIRSFLATDPGFVQMFIAEARLASRLNHANIAQIFDFDKHEDTFYIAMEYVRGCSLWDMRRRCRERMIPVPSTLVAQLGLEVARGLHYAHQLKSRGTPVGLVHRDVTPHNVLLSWEGAIKLTDFGIAKAGNTLTSPGMLKGKFAYMSPEQARGENVDARTDVFALGIVLWELLTGGRLFEGDSDVAVLRAVQQSVIPPPARLNPDVPTELDAIVMRALERDLDARYASAQELERALGQFILRHAKSIDDTDFGGFLRRLYPDEAAEERSGRTHSGISEPSPLPEPVKEVAAPRVREPTAVMPGRPGAAPPEVSADEDAFAQTYLLERARAAAADGRQEVASATGLEETAVPAARHEAPVVATSPISFDSSAKAARGGPTGDVVSAAVNGAVAPVVAAQRDELPADGHNERDASAVFARGGSAEPNVRTPAQDRIDTTANALTEAFDPGRHPSNPTTNPKTSGVHSESAVESTAVAAAAIRRRSSRRVASAVGAVVALLAVAGVSAVVTCGPAEDPTSADGQPHAQGEAQDASIVLPPSDGAADAGDEDAGTAEGEMRVDAGGTGLAVVADGGRPAPPTPPVTTEDRRGKGILLLNVTPWANVFIDGVNQGDVSGKREFLLPAGKYVVRFQHQRRRAEKIVVVRSGRRQLLQFDAFAD